MFDQETWKFTNTFAPWLSAFGAVSTVIASPDLAGREKYSPGSEGWSRVDRDATWLGDIPECLANYVVNVVHREARLTIIGWKAGIFTNRYAVQAALCTDGLSSPLPVRLKDGEGTRYFFIGWRR